MTKTIKTIFIFFSLLLGIFFADFALANVYDLEVVSIAVDPSQPIQNKLCSVIITIKSVDADPITDNAGVSSYSYDFEDFGLSEVILPDISADNPIEQGGTFQYTIKGVFNEKGEKTLNFVVNEGLGWPETRLTNNDLRAKTTVITGYDLEVSSITMKPSSPSPGQRVRFTVPIKNSGQLDLINNVGVSSINVDFDDFNLMDIDMPDIYISNPLSAGGSVDIVLEGAFLSSGEKTLNFTIDYDDALDETNEENNLATSIINIIPAEELDVSVLSIETNKVGGGEEIMIGDDVDIIIKIENSGNVSFTDAIGIDRSDTGHNFNDYLNTNVEHTDYPTLDEPFDPGEVLTYTYKGSFTEFGEKKLGFTVDKFEDLIESDEENNYLEKFIYVYSSQDEIDQFEILDVSYSLISSTRAKIYWTTSKNTTGEVMYRRDFYNYYNMYIMGLSDWPSSDSEATEHSVELSNLMQDEKYVFEIKAFRGEVDDSTALMDFTTPIDDSVNLVGGLNEEIDRNAGTLNLTWDTNIISSGDVYYKITGEGDYVSASSGDSAVSHNVIVEELEPGYYEYYVESVSGDYSYKSDIRYFTISSTEDVGEPEESEEGLEPDEESELDKESEVSEELSVDINNEDMHSNLRGKIMLKVEENGEAYYIHPEKQEMYYLGRPDDAFSVMREQGVGITNENLEKIPVGLSNLTGSDSDGDGLPDLFEDAIGTDKNNIDTDGDGYNDKDELSGGYNPNGSDKLSTDSSFSSSQAGKIFLQVENNGEAWYVNPEDNKRYFLGRPADAFSVMRNLGLGISTSDFDSMR